MLSKFIRFAAGKPRRLSVTFTCEWLIVQRMHIGESLITFDLWSNALSFSFSCSLSPSFFSHSQAKIDEMTLLNLDVSILSVRPTSLAGRRSRANMG